MELLDGSRTTDSLADELEGWLRAAAAAKGLDLGQPATATGPAPGDEYAAFDAAFCRQIVLDVWAEDQWRPGPPVPSEQGRVKKFDVKKGFGFIEPGVFKAGVFKANSWATRSAYFSALALSWHG